MRDAYTVAEVADEIGVSEPTIRRYINQGLVEAEKVGGIWLIADCSLERLLDHAAAAELDEDLDDEDVEDDDDFEDDEEE